MEVGKRIKLLRVAAGMDQKELAGHIGVSSSLVSLIESGLREPSLSQLRKFAKVFKVPVSLLVFEMQSELGDGSQAAKVETEHMHDLMLKIFSQYLQNASSLK